MSRGERRRFGRSFRAAAKGLAGAVLAWSAVESGAFGQSGAPGRGLGGPARDGRLLLRMVPAELDQLYRSASPGPSRAVRSGASRSSRPAHPSPWPRRGPARSSGRGRSSETTAHRREPLLRRPSDPGEPLSGYELDGRPAVVDPRLSGDLARLRPIPRRDPPGPAPTSTSAPCTIATGRPRPSAGSSPSKRPAELRLPRSSSFRKTRPGHFRFDGPHG